MASTTNAQRIGIWIIVIVLGIGTLASFVAIIVSNNNNKDDQEALATACKEYTSSQDKQNSELKSKYYDTLKSYESRVGEFDKADITEVKTEDLVVGDGTEINEESSYSAYYIGWNPSGKVFDESIDGDKLKAPLPVSPGGVIKGWTEGTKGMKVGGIREISIPSEKAYGSAGSGADIPADTPIKFVVMIIPTPAKLNVPDALKQYQAYIDAGYVSYVCQ